MFTYYIIKGGFDGDPEKYSVEECDGVINMINIFKTPAVLFSGGFAALFIFIAYIYFFR